MYKKQVYLIAGTAVFFCIANHAIPLPYNHDISLSDAIQIGSLKQVEAALKGGVKLNELLPEKKTPLILASEQDLTNNMKKIITFMVKKGANVNQPDGSGQTALMIAAAAGKISTVKFLVEQGANIALENKDGKTAIELTKNKGIKEYLAKTLENKNLKKQGILSRIMGSASQGVLDAKPEAAVFVWARDHAGPNKDASLEKDSLRGLRDILLDRYTTEAKKINAINFQGPYGYSALHYAVVHADVPLAKLLLDNGALPFTQDANGQTPLYQVLYHAIATNKEKTKAMFALFKSASTGKDYNEALDTAFINLPSKNKEFLMNKAEELGLSDSAVHVKYQLDDFYVRIARTLYAMLAQINDDYKERTGKYLEYAPKCMALLEINGAKVSKNDRKKYLCPSCMNDFISFLGQEFSYVNLLKKEEFKQWREDFVKKMKNLAIMMVYLKNYAGSMVAMSDPEGYEKTLASNFSAVFKEEEAQKKISNLYSEIGVNSTDKVSTIRKFIFRKAQEEPAQSSLWRQILYLFMTEGQKEVYDAFVAHKLPQLRDKGKKHYLFGDIAMLGENLPKMLGHLEEKLHSLGVKLSSAEANNLFESYLDK